MSKHKALAELQEGMRHLKNNSAQRAIVSNYAEVAKTLGVSRMSIYRYRQLFADFPACPTLKVVVRIWAEQKGIPRKRGPRPSHPRKQVVQLEAKAAR